MDSRVIPLPFTFMILITCCCLFFNITEASGDSNSHNKKSRSPAIVVGIVYCNTCLYQNSSKLIAGAVVAVECKVGRNTLFWKELKTNMQGVFRLHLPDDIAKHIKRIRACSVKLVRSSHPFCVVSSTSTTTSSLKLKTKKHAIHVYSAGFFTFRPPRQPETCDQKPLGSSAYEVPALSSRKLQQPPVLPPAQFIPGFLFPPNPFQPPSLIPPNPFQPPSLLPPNPLQPPPSILPPNPFRPPSLLPPNPFQPPPSILPPNPFQPPPASVLPPNPFQPSPPPFFHIPTFPGLTPPSPPPFFHIPTIPGFTPSPPPARSHFPPFPFIPPSPHSKSSTP